MHSNPNTEPSPPPALCPTPTLLCTSDLEMSPFCELFSVNSFLGVFLFLFVVVLFLFHLSFLVICCIILDISDMYHRRLITIHWYAMIYGRLCDMVWCVICHCAVWCAMICLFKVFKSPGRCKSLTYRVPKHKYLQETNITEMD